MQNIGVDIEVLINKMARMPGFGPRSARRVVLHLLSNKEKFLKPLLDNLHNVYENVKVCPICGNIDTFEEICSICSNELRSSQTICIVESVADLWAIERSKCFSGKYHVLKWLLSSIEGKGPEVLMLENLVERCRENSVAEIIIALSATIDGQTTDQYIRNYIRSFDEFSNMKITSLAVGIPLGGELDFMDDGTLFTAFNFRK